ncbi:MAG: hypothetical protein ACYDAC_09925 [Candidatus Dormibacteria bacterium]
MPAAPSRPPGQAPARRRVILRFPRTPLRRGASLGFRGAATALLVAVGIIHLWLAPTYLQGAAYVGVLFFATAAVALITALAIAVGLRGAWILGGATCAGAAAGLVASVTVGLPGGFRDSLGAPGATLSLLSEVAFIALYLLAATVRRSLLLDPRDPA